MCVVRFDDRDGNTEAYCKESLDGGRTWSAERRLTDAAGRSERPMIALAGDTAHVVWSDTRGGNAEINYKRGRWTEQLREPPTTPGSAARVESRRRWDDATRKADRSLPCRLMALPRLPMILFTC